jgi:DNA-binding protein
MNSEIEHQAKVDEKPASTEHQAATQAAKDDKIVRVTRNSSIRAQIGYAMKRVKSGDQITIQALGLAMSKAILLASIVRDRIGNVHMLNTMQEVDSLSRPESKVSGISIVLTT